MKKSKITLALYLGCIALSVAGISLSVAWYAAANRLRISSIDITIDCDRELFISTSPDGEFVEKLNYNDLNHSGDFLPLTSAHSSTWLNNKSDTPVFFDETRYSSYEYAELYSPSNRGYYSQKFYLKSDDDVYVTLDYEKTFLNANPEYNKSYAERLYEEYQASDNIRLKNLTKEEIELRLNRLINAMRFSILVTDSKDYSYTIIDPNKRDIPIIATQEKFPFANKAIKASIPMTMEVIPKATPKILQSMNIVNVESNMPINVMQAM